MPGFFDSLLGAGRAVPQGFNPTGLFQRAGVPQGLGQQLMQRMPQFQQSGGGFNPWGGRMFPGGGGPFQERMPFPVGAGMIDGNMGMPRPMPMNPIQPGAPISADDQAKIGQKQPGMGGDFQMPSGGQFQPEYFMDPNRFKGAQLDVMPQGQGQQPQQSPFQMFQGGFGQGQQFNSPMNYMKAQGFGQEQGQDQNAQKNPTKSDQGQQ